ncbi:Putative mycofactocin radical SAM maturase MftC [Thermoflexales bacterium]|nr:Putative mycofactocin radical SAM maturase MftC [Thermoflexales bacterium]
MSIVEEVLTAPADFRRAVSERVMYPPVYVKVKLFFGCNLKCAMCNHWRETREPPLSITRFREVLAELAELGCRKIHFSGGEPLLRPHVPDLVAHATQLGLRTTLTTNGTLVDKEMAKRLVEAGLRGVNVSIDSPDRKLHDQIRGERGAWKKAAQAVKYFRRYAHKGKLNIRLNTVVGRYNYLSLAPLADFAHELGADALNLIPVDDHCGEHLAPRKRDIAEYNARLAPLLAERALALGLIQREAEVYPFGRTATDRAYARRGEYAQGWYATHPCFMPWVHSLIDFNGLVYVCCMTREQISPLGDLKQSSFREIWTGARYQAIRQQMHPPALKPCRRCDDFLEENKQLLEIAEEGKQTS